MGEPIHDVVLTEAPPETDTARLARGARIVDRLNRARGGEPIEVWFVDVGRNALTLPGPRTYVGSGLFDCCTSDAAIAFVVAHEMAHVDLGHLDGARLPGGRRAADETAADRAAIELLRRAGFAESGARDAFDVLASAERDLDLGLAPELGPPLAAYGIARKDAPLDARRRALWGIAPRATDAPVRAAHGLATTGATVACAACRVRFPSRTSCPMCGDPEIFALASPGARERFLAVPAPQRMSPAATVFLFGGLAVVVGLEYLLLWLRITTVVTDILPVVYAIACCGWLSLARRPPSHRLRPVHGPLLRNRWETSVGGTVRLVRATTSPLGTRCAAWRLRGRGPGGKIDDAGVGAFEVLAGDRVVARVESDDALVDLGPDPTRVRRRVEGGLAAFFAERGRVGEGARAALGETVLFDGDTVEVSGVADEVVIPGAYRDAGAVPLYRDWPTIRKLEAARRRPGEP